MKKRTTLPPKPIRAAQVPVTVQMLNESEERLGYKIDSGLHQFKAEVKYEFRGVRSEIAGLRSDIANMDSKFAGMDSKFSGMDSKFSGMDSKFASMESNIEFIKSDVAGIKSELHRVALLVEEQNARNKFVLDGYAQLYELIERKLG